MDLQSIRNRFTGEMPTINNVEFYTETVRVINEYLENSPEETPAESLQAYVRAIGNGNRSTAPESPIDVEIGSAGIDRLKDLQECSIGGGRCRSPLDEYRRRHKIFLEEIRHILLRLLVKNEADDRIAAANFHMYVHLVELSIMNEMSLFEKISEFLNVNFKLKDDDFLGHARRGNFGELVRMRPSLSQAIEELVVILDAAGRTDEQKQEKANREAMDERLQAWQAKHNISSDLFKIMNGKHKHFANPMEECCYDFAYNNPVRCTNKYTDILLGNYAELIAQSKGWLKLILMLGTCYPARLKEYEALFEMMYSFTVGLDNHLGLEFLAYSRASKYYFNILVGSIAFNCVNVELFIAFAKKNKIDCTHLFAKYARSLQMEKNYSNLCRFIVNHSVCGICYDRELVDYFVKHFLRYRAFIQEDFLRDPANRFILLLYGLPDTNYEALSFLIDHSYADWFLDDIVNAVLDSRLSDDVLLVKCLRRVIQVKELILNSKTLKAKILQKLQASLETPS